MDIKRLKRFTNLTRNKLSISQQQNHLEDEFKKLWQKANKKNLKYLILCAKEKSIQKRAWEEFKNHKDITLDDIYELMGGPRFLEKELWKMFIELGATPEDLLDVIKYEECFQERAWEDLYSRMKKGVIKKARSRRILMEIIELKPSFREKAWKLLKKLNPSEKKLRKILDMEFAYSAPGLTADIERFIRKRVKKNHGLKTAHKIEETLKQINELKKGQE